MSLPSALAAGAAGLLVSGVVAELGARVWLRTRDRWFVHRPHAARDLRVATDVLPQLEPLVRFRANADGERAGPVPPRTTERWLVAGGSAAECFLLDQDTMWSSVMGRELSALRGRPVHVGNVARSLIPTRTIAALLSRSLPHFQGLDVIVLMVGASDLVAWLELETPATLPAPEPLGEIDVVRYAEENPAGPFGWTHPKRTALYRIARRLGARLARTPDVRERAGGSIAKHRARRAAAKELLDTCTDPSAMLEAYRRDLAALIEVCRTHAKRVVVVRQPWLDREFTAEEAARLWNFGQGSPYRGEIDTYYTHRLIGRLMADVERVSAEVAEAEGVEHVELRPVVPSDFDHYYDYLHFTPKGAEVVGRAIVDALERH